MSSGPTDLTTLGRTVRRGDEVVAELTYGGMISVRLPGGGKVIGRLLDERRRGDPRYHVFTALHQYADTPSDTMLTEETLPLTEAVALLLEREEAPSDDEGNSHDE